MADNGLTIRKDGDLETLGKYRLIRRIAVGEMSTVYLAALTETQGLQRAVIVKSMREGIDAGRKVKETFLDEARIAACLKHPNIVHLYDVGEENDVPYLAMEYIFGRNLYQIVKRARQLGLDIPVQFALKLTTDVLAGLHYAYNLGEKEGQPLRFVHRDISPHNILVSFEGMTKLVDFGIAKARVRLSKTKRGVLKGKYAYMSPEQVKGKTLDDRSDQFSLAIVIYELLSGTRLFKRENEFVTMEAVESCEVPPLRVLCPELPKQFTQAIHQALQRNPKDRFESHKEMERALASLAIGSYIEQTEQQCAFLYDLFAEELRTRREHIDAAEDQERELIMSAGFELLGLTTVDPTPVSSEPGAQERYRELVARQQAVVTDRNGRPFTPGERPRETDQEDVTLEVSRRRKSGGLKPDGRLVLVIICLIVMFGSLYLLLQEYLAEAEQEAPPPANSVESAPPTVDRPESAEQPDGGDTRRIVAGLVNEGREMLKHNKTDTAIAAFHRAIRLDPENCDALISLGIAYATSGKRLKAARYYQLFVDRCPTHAGAKKVRKVLQEFSEYSKQF